MKKIKDYMDMAWHMEMELDMHIAVWEGFVQKYGQECGCFKVIDALIVHIKEIIFYSRQTRGVYDEMMEGKHIRPQTIRNVGVVQGLNNQIETVLVRIKSGRDFLPEVNRRIEGEKEKDRIKELDTALINLGRIYFDIKEYSKRLEYWE